MVLTIYIPVLFVCLNTQCSFAQTQKHYVRETECMAVLEEYMRRVREMAASAGQTVTQLKGVCVVAKDGLL